METNTEIGSYFKGGREYVKTTVRVPVLTYTVEGETRSKEFGALAMDQAVSMARQIRDRGARLGYAVVSLKWVNKEIESETETSMERRGS